MSAFLVNEEHIGLLAAYYHDKRHYDNRDTAVETARRLAQANMASMRARYGDPGCGDPEAYVCLCQREALRHVPDTIPPLLILKMCDCLEYQSCEVEHYYESEGYAAISRIRATAIRCLGDYDGMPGWEFSRARFSEWIDSKRKAV